VRYVGNVTPQGNDDGTDVETATLYIGNTDLGGIFIDAAPALDNLPDFITQPLASEAGILGKTVDGVGRVELTDGRWNVTDSSATALIVGDSGFGLLDLFTSSVVNVTGGTVVGNEATGQGQVTINTIASRLRTDLLTVGKLGVGSIDLNNTGSIVSRVSLLGNMSGSMGTVTLNDTSRWDLRGPLNVGGVATTAHGFLNINDQALLQANTSASVTVNPQGVVEFSGGTLRQIGSGTSVVTNGGVISGDGFIDAALTLSETGVLSNRAGIANTREHLRVAGAVTNGGTIDSFGGEMTFESAVTNTLELIARDAIVTFNGGLTNSGAGNVVIGGDTTLHAVGGAPLGGIVFTAGKLQVLSDSAATLVGDITFSGSSVLALTIGPDAGTLDVTGVADLSSATFELGYSAGIASQSGDSYQIFQAGGGFGPGFTPTAALADGRTWIIDTLGTSDKLFATALGPTTNPLASDFNGDGIVDALDIAIWSANFGTVGTPPPPILGDADGDGDVNGADFLQIQMDFGMTFPLSSAVAAVPEPSVVLLAALAVGCCSLRRRSF